MKEREADAGEGGGRPWWLGDLNHDDASRESPTRSEGRTRARADVGKTERVGEGGSTFSLVGPALCSQRGTAIRSPESGPSEERSPKCQGDPGKKCGAVST